VDGKAVPTREVLVFEVDGHRGISRVGIFIQTPQAD
jgi:hypothetical protein